MALNVSGAKQVNGSMSSSLAEEEELYSQLLRLRDAVVAGSHPQFRLPPAVVETLKASQAHAPAAVAEQPAVNGLVKNGVAFNANAATNNAQQFSTPSTAPTFPGLPGLQAPSFVSSAVPATLKPTSSGGLDPIFLEKSDSLVRAEGQLKRQRLERDVQISGEQRKYTRDKDSGADAPSSIDVDGTLTTSIIRASHVSGLMSAKAGSPASSFDENDYYSSQVESAWSSPESASKGSDRVADVFAATFERAEGVSAPSSSFAAKASSYGKQRAQPAPNPKDRSLPSNGFQVDDAYDFDDEDDEYTPPDATAFDTLGEENAMMAGGHITPPEDDDNSEYEPGEITQESLVPAPYCQGQQLAQPSPKVPVIRNHLTHIAAPQPNRVSPLAVAKRPSIELELVNGRPEVVSKGRPNHNAVQSRASTASPAANGVGSSGKKRQKKKRKREQEPTGRNKKRRERQAAAQSPPSPAHQEPRIKDEPISPPPFVNVPEMQQPYGTRATQYRPAEIDLVSPRHVPQMQYAHEAPRSGLRYEYPAPSSPAVVRVASPAAYRPVQRDTQDLRRVASMHYAAKPPSPTQRAYSPAPQRTVSMTYGDPRLARAPEAQETQGSVQYIRSERSPSPPRLQEYQDPYARVQSPAMMPPPAAPPRRIIVDQYGNRYIAAEPAPAPPPAPSRASVAPSDRRPTMELGYERAPSRMATSYGQPPPTSYESADPRMAPPPPPPQRRPTTDDRPVQYVDANGYRLREYEPPGSQVRYVEAPTSPAYQPAPVPRYENMAPPPAREQTSPVYVPTRSYSVRPEEAAPMQAGYTARQASVAPVQYGRPEAPSAAPARAMSVVPGYEQPAPSARAYSHAPQQVRYVDQYGREVYPSEVRQVPAADYRYQ